MVDLERVGEEVQDGLWSRYWEKGWGEMGAGAEGRVRDGGASEIRKSKAVFCPDWPDLAAQWVFTYTSRSKRGSSRQTGQKAVWMDVGLS